jgi:hypothetical protein
MDNFKDLARRLLQVDPQEVAEKQAEHGRTKKG